MVPYFSGVGFSCPVTSNPADYFVDVSSVDERIDRQRREDKKRVMQLIETHSRKMEMEQSRHHQQQQQQQEQQQGDDSGLKLDVELGVNNESSGVNVGVGVGVGVGGSRRGGNGGSINRETKRAEREVNWWWQVQVLAGRFLVNNIRDFFNLLGGLCQGWHQYSFLFIFFTLLHLHLTVFFHDL